MYHRSQTLPRAAHLLIGCGVQGGGVRSQGGGCVRGGTGRCRRGRGRRRCRRVAVRDRRPSPVTARHRPQPRRCCCADGFPCVLRPCWVENDGLPDASQAEQGPSLWLHSSWLLTSRHLLRWPERQEKPSVPTGSPLPLPIVSVKGGSHVKWHMHDWSKFMLKPAPGAASHQRCCRAQKRRRPCSGSISRS